MAKASKKQALGRGLSALLKDPKNDIQEATDKGAEQLVGSIVELDISSIEANPFQPRTNFKEEAIQELATSIKELGLIQPITVRKIGFNKFQLVSGERRYRAFKFLGKKQIPAYIRLAKDSESLEMALVENIQRQDLDPIEIALSYQRLIDEINLTQEQMSQRVGKKRSTITNYLRLLKLDPIIQTGMRDGFLSMGHGRALVNVESFEQQLDIYEQIITKSLSVRAAEELVRELAGKKSGGAKKQKKELPQFINEAKNNFSNFFDAKIDIKASSNGKGKITIPFTSKDDFDRILKLINRD